MGEAWICEPVRTPRGRGRDNGSLYPVRPVDLLATALRAVRDRSGLDTRHVDDVVIGCVTQTGEQGACIARFAALTAGYDEDATGVTLNRFCGSGLEAVNHAAAMVASGYADLVVAGGVESMSRVPMGADGGAIFDAQTQWDIGSVPQGISADLLATLHGFSRDDVDAFALRSQERAAAAILAGRFSRSLTPVLDAGGLPFLEADEYPRADTTLASLGKLKPAFATLGETFGLDALTRRRYPQLERLNHVHTAGNSSGIVDGAAAMIVTSPNKARTLGLRPRARIRAVALAGADPVAMLTGPIPASRKALAKAGLSVAAVDLWEINEAFAVVPLLTARELGIDLDRVNVNGGAIALGHPLGATGAIILGTLIDELEARNLNIGVATLCIGGGMGIATVVERA
jgi:acetyl-CoA C-acetyltransferase